MGSQQLGADREGLGSAVPEPRPSALILGDVWLSSEAGCEWSEALGRSQGPGSHTRGYARQQSVCSVKQQMCEERLSGPGILGKAETYH